MVRRIQELPSLILSIKSVALEPYVVYCEPVARSVHSLARSLFNRERPKTRVR